MDFFSMSFWGRGAEEGVNGAGNKNPSWTICSDAKPTFVVIGGSCLPSLHAAICGFSTAINGNMRWPEITTSAAWYFSLLTPKIQGYLTCSQVKSLLLRILGWVWFFFPWEMELGKHERKVLGRGALEEKQTVRHVEKCWWSFFLIWWQEGKANQLLCFIGVFPNFL